MILAVNVAVLSLWSTVTIAFTTGAATLILRSLGALRNDTDRQTQVLDEIHDKVDGQGERIAYLEGAAGQPFRGHHPAP